MADKDFLDRFKKAILKVATSLNKHPRDVSQRDIRRAGIDVSERQMMKRGGLQACKDICFPSDSPFRKAHNADLTGHELSTLIADLIAELCHSRGVPAHEITWDEFRQFINLRYGKNDRGVERYIITRAGGFNQIRDAYFPPKPTEISTDKQRLKQHAGLNRKLGSYLSDYQFVLDRLQEYAESIFANRIPPVVCPYEIKAPTTRILNLVLSDLHFGSDISDEETGSQTYSKREEARRLAFVVKETVNYKPQYRENTELEVLLLGDIFQNSLHDARDGAVLAEQMARSIHLLLQALEYLAANFKKVRVRCAVGNHGRFLSRHHSRAIHGKFDSAETVVYVALKAALRNVTNIEFFIPKTPYVTYPIFNKKVLATHGDTVLHPGNPGKAIQIGQLENQTNRMNASLMDSEEYSIFVCGHVHTASVTFLSNGSTMITNGALVPADPFAIALGIPETQCGQWLFESVEGYPVGDTRFIRVGKDQDQDKSLSQIIQPWSEF